MAAPEIDSRVSKGINTYDLKRREQLEVDVEKLYQERHPDEDPRDKRIRQLELDREQDKKEKEVAKIAKHLSTRKGRLMLRRWSA